MNQKKYILLRGGSVCDGTGKAPELQDILIEKDRIAGVGHPGAFDKLEADSIDVSGKTVAPGFIDAHSHGDTRFINYPENRTKLLQGVTTEVIGNCGHGGSSVPGKAAGQEWRDLAEYADVINGLGISTNTVVLAGHNTIRREVMGSANRKAEPEDIRKMRKLLEKACEDGAAGFTTGLTYFPGKFSDTAEVTALTAVFRGSQKIYATHMRSEGDTLMEALDEAFAAAEAGSGRLQVSHLKTIFPRNFHKIDQLLSTLKRRREQGMFVHADRYPYIYSSTRIGQILPAPYDKDTEITAKLKTSEEFQQEITTALKNSPRDLPTTILMNSGKTIAQLASEKRLTVEETAMLVLKESADQPAAFLCMSEENMMRILAEPWVCAGSDGLAMQLDDPESKGHPRSVGTFPTFFRLVSKMTSVEEAVRRMTSLPASIFRIPERGIIREGYFADLVVFDPTQYDSEAGFDGSCPAPTGVRMVMVGGKTAWDAANPSKVLRAGKFLPVD